MSGGLLSIAAAALAASGLVAHAAADAGDSHRFRKLAQQPCVEHVIDEDFGGGTKVQITIKSGSTDGEIACPAGSLNKHGKISYTCRDVGLFKISNTCYDCPALRQITTYKNTQREVSMTAGINGNNHTEKCEFLNGIAYKYGAITYKCENNRWQHVETTCTDFRCPSGKATVDFNGTVGKVHYEVGHGSGKLSLACPGNTANPAGEVLLECGAAKDGQAGEWMFMSQTCQACNPMSAEVKFENHTKTINVAGGALNGVVEHDCKFNDHQYANGKIVYKCLSEGWKLWETTCSEHVCPQSIMNLRMNYHDSTVVNIASAVSVPASQPGRFEVRCPPASVNPNGRILVECMKDSTWKLLSAECTGTTLVRPS
mmetsp:Transcript_121038/g.347771  ORF Transcript_121038/g.347771 Transcript_121038/m.347771 type:complete len:371 (-) Transcript_121038:225-1337(-)